MQGDEGVTPSPALRAPTSGRLSLLVTGSVNAALVPFWLNWLRHSHPGLQLTVGVTRAAERFVTLDAIAQMTGGPVFRDRWEDVLAPPNHVELEREADFFGIYPASMNTLAKLASGVASSPMLLALQMTSKPIAIADAFPVDNEVTRDLRERLSKRRHLRFVEHVAAYSVSAGSWSATTGFHLPNLLDTVAHLVSQGASKDV